MATRGVFCIFLSVPPSKLALLSNMSDLHTTTKYTRVLAFTTQFVHTDTNMRTHHTRILQALLSLGSQDEERGGAEW
jgi:hypothetical protein